jgi:hypothetical protein
MHIYEYYAAHPEDRACFSRAMGNISALVAQGTVQHYDFSRTQHIVDVGGADGGLLLAILDVNPHVRGTVFDRPHVVEAARQAIHAKNYQARWRCGFCKTAAQPSSRTASCCDRDDHP